MTLNRDALTAVVDADAAVGHVDPHGEGVHARVTLLIVGSVDEDLIEDLVEAKYVGDLTRCIIDLPSKTQIFWVHFSTKPM